MDAVALAFLDKSRYLITSDYVPKIERCLDRLPDADIWWRPNEASNSIGNVSDRKPRTPMCRRPGAKSPCNISSAD